MSTCPRGVHLAPSSGQKRLGKGETGTGGGGGDLEPWEDGGALTSFKELKEIQQRHSKEIHLICNKYEIQPYLKNPKIHTKDKHTLTAVRSQCVRNVRMNFPTMNKFRLNCPLLCNNETAQPDTQRHLLKCPKLNTHNLNNVSIEHSVKCLDT